MTKPLIFNLFTPPIRVAQVVVDDTEEIPTPSSSPDDVGHNARLFQKIQLATSSPGQFSQLQEQRT